MLNWGGLFRFTLAAILAAGAAGHAAPAETGQLDASPALFTVMAAINAAGYDADLDSPNNHPIRQAIRQELAKRNIPSLDAIKSFVAKHHRTNPTAELSQYISFALSVGPPPNFEFKEKGADIPPDVGEMTAFQPLMVRFYKEANIEDLWKRAQPAIDQAIERYHGPVSDAVLACNLYLRQQTSGFSGRRFQIYVELQAPPNQIQTRSYGNEYFVVVTPSPDLRILDIRHGYLTYLLDPLATKYQEAIARKKPVFDHAQRAEALPEHLRLDYLLLTTESLVKAIEARLDKQPGFVEQSLKQGYILTPYFAEKLPVYEKQEAAMVVYYRDLIYGIDMAKEEARLGNVEFDSKPLPARTLTVTAPAPAPPTGAAKTLDDAEQLYSQRELDKAKTLYLQVLQQTDQKPMHAAAYYGLARIAALQKDPETSERLFQKVLELEPEPPVKAWTLVYLGRLSMAAGDNAAAGKYFRDALQVAGASDMARKAAEQGVAQTSNKEQQ
jgi:tetratricopeptide (TPR) repeat protein